MRILIPVFALLAHPIYAYEVISIGMKCPEVPDGEMVEAPDTELGWVREGSGSTGYDVAGTYVPAEMNLSFGVIFRAPEGIAPTTGLLVLEHPPMGPEGITRQTHPTTLLPGRAQGTNWIFEFDYERVQGTWTRSLEVDGETVWSVDFLVGPAGSNGLINEVCFRAAPMS